jgi:hypothetical protein
MPSKADAAFLLSLLAGGVAASCRLERAGDAEAQVDTGYAIAAYRTEAKARRDLDWLASDPGASDPAARLSQGQVRE